MKLHNFKEQLRIGVFPSVIGNKLDEIEAESGKSMYILDGYIVKLLSEILKFSYKLLPNTAIGADHSDGNWTGCIGMVQRGEADIAICSAAVTEERSQVVNFSFPYIYSPITFVTDKPQPLPNSYAIIYAFSWHIWLTLIISFLSMSIFIYRIFGKKQTYSTILLLMFGTLTEQSFKMKPKVIHARLTIITWIIGIMCITYSYKAVLLASFSFPYFSGIFHIEDLSEAAENPSFQCGIREGSYVYNVLMQSEEGRISNCIRRTPKLQNYDDFLKNSSYKKAAIACKNYLSMYGSDF